MFKNVKARLLLIAALLLVSVGVLVQRGVTLGLDLRGGTHLALEIDDPHNAITGDARADAIDRALQIIRTRVDELGVAEPTIQKVGQERIIVELPGATAAEQERARDVIQRAASLKFQIVRPASDIENLLPRIDRAVAARFGGAATPAPAAASPGEPSGAVGGLFQRTDSTQPDSASADSAAAAAPTAAGDSAARTAPFTSKLSPSNTPGEFLVAAADVPAMEQYLESPEVQAIIPRSLQFRWGTVPARATPEQRAYRSLYLLEARPLMTGEHLEDAQAQRDPQFGRPIVTFTLDRPGGRTFERGTGQHVGDFMAIVLDENVFSAPIINSAIGSHGQIEMAGGTIEEARDLALVLRAGSLPAPIKIVEERTIGPSLGADSIEKGQLAGVVGVLLVIAIMIGYYRMGGAMAIGALVVYLALVLGSLSLVGATLTMPGIAGIVLSVGMAVDANVLIFERIREELDAGRSVRMAVSEGFSNAMSSIVDSQLTTLLTAAVLFQFGTGPIRGFAVTLSIGIIASLFTAIFVTRSFFMLYLERRPGLQELKI